jgi:hypothetical protein
MAATIKTMMRNFGPARGETIEDPYSVAELPIKTFYFLSEPWNCSVGDATPIMGFDIEPGPSRPSKVYLAIEDGPTRRWDFNAESLQGQPIDIQGALGPRPKPRWILAVPA